MGYQDLLGDPVFSVGLGLLSAGRDRRIDPYQQAVQGLLGSSQFNQQQRSNQIQEELFGMKKQQAETETLAQQTRRTALGQVQGLLAQGDKLGAARTAIGSGDPDLIRLGSGLLSPETSDIPASIKEYEYLEKLRKDNPAGAENYQSILQPPRSAYFTPVQSSTGIFKFDTRTGDLVPAVPPGGSGMVLPVAADPAVKGNVAQAEASGRATGESTAKREFTMGGVTDIVDQADAILSGEVKPTGSKLGTAYDTAAALIGNAPKGAAEADQLKVLSGYLVSKMPRMEGPQSDKDVEVYRQMAADVGNSSLPIERRKAALLTLRGIVSKYDKAQGGAAPTKDGWGIKKLP